MQNLLKRIGCLLLVVGLLLPGGVVVAEDVKPVAMGEVSKMIKSGESSKTVLEAMASRGVKFRYSRIVKRQLTKLGFTKHELGFIKRIASGEKIKLEQLTADGGFPVGYTQTSAEHAAEKKRMVRAIRSVGYQRIELKRCTLYCDAKRHAALLPMLKKLESDVIKYFPESISNAICPDSAHIVIVDGESQWSMFVDAFLNSYAEDGMEFEFGHGSNTRDVIKKGSGMYFPMVALQRGGHSRGDHDIARFAAYAVGHLMMHQAGGEHHPQGLRTGFGNLTETIAFKTPSVTAISYTDRALSQVGGWSAGVLQRFHQNEITKPNRIWALGTDTMKTINYAECWSYVSFLAQDPEKFAQAVDKVRQGKASMKDAVREVYGMDGKKLLKAWYRSAN